MDKITCIKCNTKFESNGLSGLCVDCRRRRHTNSYLIIAIILLVLGFIGGIMLGYEYPSLELTYESSVSSAYNEYEESFNGLLMLCSWTGTFVLCLFIFAIHSICHRLDIIIDKDKCIK